MNLKRLRWISSLSLRCWQAYKTTASSCTPNTVTTGSSLTTGSARSTAVEVLSARVVVRTLVYVYITCCFCTIFISLCRHLTHKSVQTCGGLLVGCSVCDRIKIIYDRKIVCALLLFPRLPACMPTMLYVIKWEHYTCFIMQVELNILFALFLSPVTWLTLLNQHMWQGQTHAQLSVFFFIRHLHSRCKHVMLNPVGERKNVFPLILPHLFKSKTIFFPHTMTSVFLVCSNKLFCRSISNLSLSPSPPPAQQPSVSLGGSLYVWDSLIWVDMKNAAYVGYWGWLLTPALITEYCFTNIPQRKQPPRYTKHSKIAAT